MDHIRSVQYAHTVKRISNAAALFCVALGVLVLLGWAFDIEVLKCFKPGLPSMKVNTALGFIVAGLALLLRAFGTKSSRLWTLGLAALLVWRGALKLVGGASGLDIGLDQWIFPDASPVRGSMPALAAINFLLTGTAILVLGLRWKGLAAAECLAGLVALISTMALLGKAYDAPSPFMAQGFTTVAVHTSLGFIILSLSIALADPRHVIANAVADGGPNGVNARRLLPPALVFPGMMGWLSLSAGQKGLVSTEFALTLMTLCNIIFAVGFSLWAVLSAKKAGNALNKEEERLRVTLRSIGDGVIAVDLDKRVTMVNRVAEKLTGWAQEEAFGKPVEDIFNIHQEGSKDPMENPVERALREDVAFELKDPFVLKARSGLEVVVADSTAPIHDVDDKMIGAVLVFRDVTAKQRTEQELLKLQKLESLAVLAGGIAHDFNNILSVILANVSLAATEEGPERADCLRDAETAVMRGSQLAVQLMGFSKGSAAIRRSVRLGGIAVEASKFAATGTSGKVVYDLKEGADVVEADPGQISQVVQNLVLNALQAMPSGGVVHVSTGTEEVHPSAGLPLEPGPYHKVVVRDEGHGMSPDVLKRVFDPFFTTKAKGNGLGLASAHSIAKGHRGHLMAESVPGQGSAFSLYLPVSHNGIPDLPRKAERATPGRGRVLVMDDDNGILKVSLRMLISLGYRPQGAANGAEAVALVEQALREGDPFDAAILDLTVPGAMGGSEAVKKMLAIQPSLKAIVASGYSADPVMEAHGSHGFAAAMPKPYSLHAMGEVLAGLIGA